MSTVVESGQSEGATTEEGRVHAWRLEQFRLLGFGDEMAALLAGSDGELGRARELARAGCPLDILARILL
jgi:hypothetical protein